MFLYMELCEQIWGGSPATDKINTGIETTDLSQESSSSQADETDSPASLESRYTPEPEASVTMKQHQDAVILAQA